MAGLRAVVLAAGRGVRMGGITPKCLLPLGDHEPMLKYVLDGLRSTKDVDELLVVTGFGNDAVQAYVTEQWGEDGLTFVFNARYASWGNFHSLRVAIDQSPGWDLLVANCDALVHPDVYARVAAGPGELVLAVEQRLRLDEEDMRVRLEGRRITAISKDIPARLAQGEYCGVSLLSGSAPRLYQDIATNSEWRGRTQVYYEDIYAEMLEFIDARSVPVEQGEYAEVDTPEDIPGAIQVVERAYATPQPS